MAELATLALLALAMAAGGFAAQWARLPPALGYLGTGILFGVIAPDVAPHGLEHAAEVGILILLFLIGLELDLKRLREALRSTAGALPFDIMVPAILAMAVGRLAGWTFLQAAALGIVVAVSSTLFGERLTARPGHDPKARQRVLGVLIAEDVAAAGLIALMVVMATGGGLAAPAVEILRTAFAMLLLTGLGVLVVPRILDEVARRHTPELMVLWSVALIALYGYLGTIAGSAELGALIAGVAAAEAGSRYVTRNALLGLRDLAGALFFFTAGVLIDPAAVWAAAPIALAIAVAFLIGKQLVHVPAALASGLSLPAALQAGAGLAAMGEFNLILVSVAERQGLAHPDLRPLVVGSMLILLPTAMLLQRFGPHIDKQFRALPTRIKDPLELIARAVRRRPDSKHSAGRWQDPLRQLIVNLVLLVAWGALAFALQGRVPEVPGPSWSRTAIWFGLTLLIAAPLLRGAYRGYRDLVWALVGLRPGERAGAGKVRARLVDTWVATSVVLVLAIISIWIPRTLPVLVGGVSVALLLGVVAWRALSSFHKALESALGRVLGKEGDTQFLDHVLDQYPWGVRFAAVSVPASSPLVGRDLHAARIPAMTGASVAALQRGKQETVNPPGETVLRARDQLVLLGDANQLARAEALIVAHGEAVRMSAQSMNAEVAEVTISEASRWVGRRLGELGIRRDTGTLIVGRLPADAQHPQAYEPGLVLEVGDRLILLGTRLQMQRAHALAEGIEEA
ncbi:MAG: cation:proton antiporter [Thermoplasmatota archaeon]